MSRRSRQRQTAQSNLLLLLAWVINAFSILVICEKPPTVVYRADMLSPADLKRQGRFLPRGMDGTRPNQPAADTSLFSHISGTTTGMSRAGSGYVSTTVDINYARRFLQDYLGGRGYIYIIHVSANFIDVPGTLLQFYNHVGEAEFAALGGIQYRQVRGWIEFREGVEQPEVRNPDYDPRFDTATSAGAQFQLAGFPEHHRAWGLHPWSGYAICSNNQVSFKRQDDTKCRPTKSALDFASDFMAAVGKPSSKAPKCKTIDSLTVEAAIGDGLTDGTTDSVFLQLGGRKKELIFLFSDPGHGERTKTSVSLKTVFGEQKVPLARIDKVVIWQRTKPHPIASDDFTLKSTADPVFPNGFMHRFANINFLVWAKIGLVFRAHCPDSGNYVRHGKYAALHKSMTSPREYKVPREVWSGPLPIDGWEEEQGR